MTRKYFAFCAKSYTRLYEQYGFRFIGEKDIHGEDVMVRVWDGNLIVKTLAF